MHVAGLDHIVLNVADAERSIAWYRDVLGLEPLRLEEWRRGEVLFASLRIDATTIIDVFETEPTGENLNHFALVVDDVDLDALYESGDFEIHGGPLAQLFGAQGDGRGFYVKDPDGNVVELRTY